MPNIREAGCVAEEADEENVNQNKMQNPSWRFHLTHMTIDGQILLALEWNKK